MLGETERVKNGSMVGYYFHRLMWELRVKFLQSTQTKGQRKEINFSSFSMESSFLIFFLPDEFLIVSFPSLLLLRYQIWLLEKTQEKRFLHHSGPYIVCPLSEHVIIESKYPSEISHSSSFPISTNSSRKKRRTLVTSSSRWSWSPARGRRRTRASG